MGKNTEIKLIGQPIFKQIVDLIEGINLTGLIKKHNSDHYYKAFKSRTHLITKLFGIFSRCDSMTEICEGLRAMGGKLNHLGLDQSPAKSTACDGLRNRDSKFFEDVYFSIDTEMLMEKIFSENEKLIKYINFKCLPQAG